MVNTHSKIKKKLDLKIFSKILHFLLKKYATTL